MDEFVKVTPAIRRIVIKIQSLSEDEGLEIRHNSDKRKGGYFITKIKKNSEEVV